MSFLSRFSPITAVNDLRRFLSGRPRYEIVFLMVSMVIVAAVLFAFVKDSHFERPYKQDIVYVEQWSAARTDLEIRKQQAIDQVAKEKRLAEINAKKAARQADFKKLDNRLKSWGL